ncbi:NosD domain-containing protein [Cellulomonas carbonis]|uniref:Periplasmic copper-binding protein NosD beta helix domain-containing protein n=1 Tax=Cellulomonas carbonis T26 TaxID=947969 RepID=A0A0A0BS67_9CELL|nr:NosD domain-containing protein [Cellulomonas carbonis]KGM10796.1 hypothetical protein N868_13785 [Cellulomonas carbonis T26]GGB92726.1 hypothetical protein GCM10010972_01770 [Cellulomonas carbonis]
MSGAAYLPDDLLCADGQGITFTASGTLDLRGHTLAGPGRDVEARAVQFDASTSSVTVVGGTVRGWWSAFTATGDPGTGSGTLRDVVVEDNGTGVGAYFHPWTVVGSSFVGNETAVHGFYGALTIDRTRFSGNDTGIAIATTRTAVTRSQFDGNRIGLYCSEAILEVRRSTFRDNETGIEHWWCGGAQVSGSTFDGNDVAYRPTYQSVADVLIGNTFVGNGTGVHATTSVALIRNTFTRNGTGVRAPDVPAVEIHLERNVFTRNVDAVHVETPATVQGNVALRNTGRGLHVPLATDLGGNVARGNPEPQCVGVVCTPHR